MVKVSTLFHRVDGFSENRPDQTRELPDQHIETQILNKLLEPLLFDPGDEVMRQLLQKI